MSALQAVLAEMGTLEILDLRHYGTGDEGASALAKALETNTSLTTLVFGCNKIGDEGAKALAQALETNTTLRTLH